MHTLADRPSLIKNQFVTASSAGYPSRTTTCTCTLSGDTGYEKHRNISVFTQSFFHMLPIILGQHGHGDHAGPKLSQGDVLGRMAVILCMGLFLYLVESMFNVFIKKPERAPKVDSVLVDVKKAEDSPQGEANAVADPEADKAEKKLPDEEFEMRNVSSFVWMSLCSDTFCNLTDGIAIGAGFSQSAAVGFAACVAVLAHEVPAELGDSA
eukprot:gene19903-1015_t